MNNIDNISENLKNKYKEIIENIQVEPITIITKDNNIQLEFTNSKNEYLKIIILDNNSIEVFEQNKERGSFYKILNTNTEKIIEIIKKFHQ